MSPQDCLNDNNPSLRIVAADESIKIYTDRRLKHLVLQQIICNVAATTPTFEHIDFCQCVVIPRIESIAKISCGSFNVSVKLCRQCCALDKELLCYAWRRTAALAEPPNFY